MAMNTWKRSPWCSTRPASGERCLPAGSWSRFSRDPGTQPFRGQLDLDRRGFVVADPELSTSCPGVFAAGDVVSGAYLARGERPRPRFAGIKNDPQVRAGPSMREPAVGNWSADRRST